MDMESAKGIIELLQVQHFSFSSSLEPILPHVESELGDPFVLMGDGESVESNLNSPEDLLVVPEKYVNQVTDVELAQLGKSRATND